MYSEQKPLIRDVYTFQVNIHYSFETGVTFEVLGDDGYNRSAPSLKIVLECIQERFNQMVFQSSQPF